MLRQQKVVRHQTGHPVRGNRIRTKEEWIHCHAAPDTLLLPLKAFLPPRFNAEQTRKLNFLNINFREALLTGKLMLTIET